MGNKKRISDDEIRLGFNEIVKGKSIKEVVEKIGISRQGFHLRLADLDLDLAAEKSKKVLNKKVKEVKNIDDLCKILDCKRNEILPLINPKKSNDANLKRFYYFYRTDKNKFEKEVIYLIIKYYKLDIISLVKVLSNK